MAQLVTMKILTPDWPQLSGAKYPLGFSLPRYICPLENQSEASCSNSACLKTEPNHCCLWCHETCAYECPEKKLNPEFIKEVGLLYRTSELPFEFKNTGTKNIKK